MTTGPLTSVKEQATGAYAAALADQGYVALSFHHLHFGESDGAPRQYEHPGDKIADIRAAAAALSEAYPGLPIHALGICAGGGYMAEAFAQEPRFQSFAGVAGFYHDAAQSREWIGDGYDAAIEAGRKARADWEKSGTAHEIPAVAKEADRAMPVDEAFAFYGTDRGGEAKFPNYRNAFAVMSREVTTPFDPQGAAARIDRPVLMIHSENALSPRLARRFHDGLGGPKQIDWGNPKGRSISTTIPRAFSLPPSESQVSSPITPPDFGNLARWRKPQSHLNRWDPGSRPVPFQLIRITPC